MVSPVDMFHTTAMVALAFVLSGPGATAPDVGFETIRISTDFFCEGASFGDFNRDGVNDIVSGPYWYEGPDFATKHELFPPKTFDPLHYSDNFFAWVRDFDGDGWPDVLFVGFPGQAAFWCENPGGEERHWDRHVVHAQVDNESPAFTDLTGDGRPELVFHTGGVIGWAGPDPADPRAPWVFHELSEELGLGRFTHGLGVGDLDGDGRRDVILKQGWWQQPDSLDGDPVWRFHAVPFSKGQGGAQMIAYDIDGDGDTDVVTSINAHGYGLSWWEQVPANDPDGEPGFVEHVILPVSPHDPPRDYAVSELHALALADMDGDGLPDVVTGKRFWSHGPGGEGGADDPPYLLWFELVREEAGGAHFVPHRIHDDSGVGVQVVVGDIDGDGTPDVVVGNKKGTFVHFQRAGVSGDVGGEEPVKAADDRPPGEIPRGSDGAPLNLDFEAGTLADWTAEGEAFEGQPIRGDTVYPRRSDMTSGHMGGYWIGTYELGGDGPHGTLTSVPFEVTQPWASFLVAGGRQDGTRVELQLEESGETIFSVTGRDHEEMHRAVADLSAYVGREIRIRLVDEGGGSWGHLNFDDFRLHATRPEYADGEVMDILDFVEHDGLSAEEAAAAMTLPEGFRVDVIAAEPDVHQPIALTIDARGRIWIAEAHAYPQKRADGEGVDRIIILEDTDGDGEFETRKVFAEGLNLVSGFEVGYGGVFVGAAPELLFIPDADGDDVPDGPPEVLLDGWHYEDTHETLNAFTFGPDGWLYGCHGVFTHSNVGPPGASDEERQKINAGVWRFHPLTHAFEVFAWGSSNPWGIDFDEHGQAFITACVIPHLYHVIQGGRYQRQAGSHFSDYVYDDIKTIADHLHWIGDDQWAANGRSGSAGGGHAHCGAMIYLGDSFPDEYRGRVFMNNVHGNRVNVDIVERAGSGFIGTHGDDFLLANDRWFRGINMEVGPDGSVFLIDWYDPQACHNKDEEIWDRTNGRVYRVSYGAPAARLTDLTRLSERALVELHEHANEWQAQIASRLLAERGASWSAKMRLGAMVANHPDATRRLRALWTLHATGGLEEGHLLTLMGGNPEGDFGPEPLFRLEHRDESEYVRAWAIQLLLESKAPSDRALDTLAELARDDPSPVVRLYLASGLQRIAPDRCWDIAERLLAHGEDVDDVNLPLLYWYGFEPLVPLDPARALALAGAGRIPLVFDFALRRAAADEACHSTLVSVLAELAEDDARVRALDQVLLSLEDQRGVAMPAGWAKAYDGFASSANAEVRDRALALAAVFGDERVFPELRSLLADDSAELATRRLALSALIRAKDAETAPILVALVADSAELRREAIQKLSSYDYPAAPPAILAGYASFSDEERGDALATLSARTSYAHELLAAVEDGTVPRAALTAVILRQLRAFGDEGLDSEIEAAWGVFRDTPEDRAAEIERWQGLATAERIAAADTSNGRDVYARTCMQCHSLFGEGGDVGPELTGSNRKDLEYILTNIIDPNAIIPKEYRVTLVLLNDERIVTGILTAENDSSVTLKTQNETVTVARDEIELMRLEEISMMPEGQLATLAEQEAIDLFAYLALEAQVPRSLTTADVGAFFDGESLAGWRGDESLWSVVDGAIVGRTGGIERNAFLVSDWQLSDFRLTLEVKLEPNTANSGIQFRSEVLEGGDVKGYQADIGAGWWGKLYEEHGRAVLFGEPGDDAVKPGEWNKYEIVAVGDRIRTAINGIPCVDLVDPEGARSGVIALQIHSGGATDVRFRNFVLELDPE
ncbi:MAG: DUF1080 domain-containing protein [Planctomycetota bacterium]|nr:MAG: DUF1080 domain-containing protein [Planctomycetota bacterium]